MYFCFFLFTIKSDIKTFSFKFTFKKAIIDLLLCFSVSRHLKMFCMKSFVIHVRKLILQHFAKFFHLVLVESIYLVVNETFSFLLAHAYIVSHFLISKWKFFLLSLNVIWRMKTKHREIGLLINYQHVSVFLFYFLGNARYIVTTINTRCIVTMLSIVPDLTQIINYNIGEHIVKYL